MKKTISLLTLVILTIVSCKSEKNGNTDADSGATKWVDSLIYPEETHFKSIKQITFGGDNAEAYWSFDDSQIIFSIKQYRMER